MKNERKIPLGDNTYITVPALEKAISEQAKRVVSEQAKRVVEGLDSGVLVVEPVWLGDRLVEVSIVPAHPSRDGRKRGAR